MPIVFAIKKMAKWRGKSKIALLTVCTLLVTILRITPCQGIDVSLELPDGDLYSETDGSIQVCVVLSEKPSGATAVSINLVILQGTADTSDIIFGGVLQVFTFSANTDTVMCLTITIIEDEETEQVESFDITISTTSAVVTVLPPSSVTISILDRDSAMAILAFEESNYIATEAGPVEVCVVVQERLSQRAVEFELMAVSGTATIGLDFIQSVDPFTIPPGIQKTCGKIPIINDTEIEGTEDFTVIINTIEQVNGSTVVTIKNTNGATIDIVSSDVAVVEMDSGATSSVSVCVELNDTDDGLLRDVVLLLNTVDETATGGFDYEPLVNQSLVIPFNAQIGASNCLTVTIIGDDYEEENETFLVTFTAHPTLNPEDIITGQSQVTVTIVDDGDVNCTVLEAPANGTLFGDSVTVMSEVTYSCDIGFILSGDTNRTCQADGNWTGNAPVCNIVNCTALDDPVNGTLTGNSVSYLSEVTYSCVTGYNLSGDTSRTCQADGNWTGSAPVCNIVNCIALEDPVNGTLTGNSVSYLSEVTYSCVTGYNLSGDASRTCQADGSWTGNDPVCNIVNCSVLEAPSNGTLTGDSVSYWSEVTYSCDLGYILSGDANRTCQADGVWSGSNPVCNLVNCTDIPPISNGTVSADHVSFGSQVNYSCNNQFDLSGDSIRTCQANGTLSGAQPSCQEKPVATPMPTLIVPTPGGVDTPGGGDDDLNLIAIIVGVVVGLLLIIAVIVIIIIIACAWSQKKKKSGDYEPSYVYDNTAAGEIAERDGEASESVNTFEYPTAASFDLPASPTAPEIPLPPEEPPETPVKVPLNRSDPFEEVEERDDESIDFLPYFSAPDGPQKTYYLRELEAEESDEERLD